jgi:hypothetical protein
MADSTERTQLIAKIVELEKEQVEFILNANYLGWTRDLEAAYDKRANQIALLRLQLVELDCTSYMGPR